MRKPKSTGSGTTGIWKKFSEKYNKLGDDRAEEARDKNKGKDIKKKKKKK
jgi:hypothetical protein